MPEFDEETHQKKSQNDQELKYEPGKNTDRYKSKKPRSQKREQSEASKTPSLWVEAATSTSYKDIKIRKKSDKPERNNPQKERNSNQKNRSGNRNPRRGRRKPPTLWEKILSFFGIKPKRKGRKFDSNRKGGKGSRNQQQGSSNRKPRDGRNNQSRGQSGDNRHKNRNERQDKSDNRPRGEGDNNPNRKNRTRNPNDERRQNKEGGPNQRDNSKRGERTPRPEGDRPRNPRPEHSENRPPRTRDDREQNRRPARREPREDTRPVRVESIAAPKTDKSTITLGAIDLGGKSTKTPEETPKPAASRGRRNRRNAVQEQTATTKTEFVPHSIDLSAKPTSAEDKTNPEG